MTERKKMILLIFSCIIMLVSLCGIQYSLIMNTFHLTKDKYETEIKQLIDNAESRKNMISLLNKSNNDIQKIFNAIANKKIEQTQFLIKLDSIKKGYEKNMRQYLRKVAKTNTALRDIKYNLIFSNMILHLHGSSDTLIVPDKMVEGIRKNPDNYSDINILRISSADLGSPFVKQNEIRISGLTYDRAELIHIAKWREPVFWRMLLQTIFATVILFIVVLLFYLIIRSMIKQRKLGEMKTDFANNISHELKTPLSSISIIVDSLKRTEIRADPGAVADLTEILHRQQVKMEHTFERIIETTFPENKPVNIYKTDLTTFLNNYANANVNTTHYISYEIEQQARIIETNTLVLENALDNLIENAKKYSLTGSKINIKAYTDITHYHIEISDQGKGIEKKYQKLIFSKFYRITEHNLHTVKGLGLGLFLSQKALKQINAVLALKQSSNEGSTFTIILKLC